MPRMARVVIPGVAHHVTQRGNRREDVFFRDADRPKYLMLLVERGRGVRRSCLPDSKPFLADR